MWRRRLGGRVGRPLPVHRCVLIVLRLQDLMALRGIPLTCPAQSVWVVIRARGSLSQCCESRKISRLAHSMLGHFGDGWGRPLLRQIRPLLIPTNTSTHSHVRTGRPKCKLSLTEADLRIILVRLRSRVSSLRSERMLGLGDGSNLLTNADLLEILDPQNPELPYLYEGFQKWGTCSDWDPCPECVDSRSSSGGT